MKKGFDAMITNTMSALMTAGTTLRQAQVQQSAVRKDEGHAGVLKAEIQNSVKTDTSAKEAELKETKEHADELRAKQSEAAKHGITFDCDFHCPSDLKGGALDMSIILNNALNNAIEAAEKCPENERDIAITSSRKKNAFIITVTNTCTGAEIADGELPHTTKSDSENHGFGLLNIKNTAEKYGGGIEIDCMDGKFTLTVMLMLQ